MTSHLRAVKPQPAALQLWPPCSNRTGTVIPRTATKFSRHVAVAAAPRTTSLAGRPRREGPPNQNAIDMTLLKSTARQSCLPGEGRSHREGRRLLAEERCANKSGPIIGDATECCVDTDGYQNLTKVFAVFCSRYIRFCHHISLTRPHQCTRPENFAVAYNLPRFSGEIHLTPPLPPPCKIAGVSKGIRGSYCNACHQF